MQLYRLLLRSLNSRQNLGTTATSATRFGKGNFYDSSELMVFVLGWLLIVQEMTLNVDPSEYIHIRSYNPYAARLPRRRVISREALDFMKALRESGYAVSVDPDDGTVLSYLTEKGLRAFLSDPLYIVLIGIPLGIVVNVTSNWLYERFRKVPSAEQASIILEVDERGIRSRYDHNGRHERERFESILGMFERRAKRYAESQAIEPPDPTRPVPLFLEHTTKLVGGDAPVWTKRASGWKISKSFTRKH